MTVWLAASAVIGLTFSGCAGAAGAGDTAYAGCEAYPSRPAAQRAWERAGAPRGIDGDGDGRVCEALPRHSESHERRACRRVRHAVVVRLSVRRYPRTADHIADAVAAGQPSVLHLDRPHASANRQRALAGVPTRPGYDRDEWPMAASRESSADSDVRYVPSADNRGAGATIGEQLSRYCDGQAFRVAIHGSGRR